jgi:hypothetical protein
MEHIDFFRGHDLASSRLLCLVGPWHAGVGALAGHLCRHGQSLHPDTFKLDDKLLVYW